MRIRKPNTAPVKCAEDDAAKKDTKELNTSVYDDAIKSVKQAIDQLGAYTRRTGDEFAKEQIANLSVVLMEMKAKQSDK